MAEVCRCRCAAVIVLYSCVIVDLLIGAVLDVVQCLAIRQAPMMFRISAASSAAAALVRVGVQA